MSNWIKELINAREQREKDVLLIDESFNYWRMRLLERSSRIFTWNGLPFPSHELESRLLWQGYAGVVDDAKCGIMVASGSMSGVTQYNDVFRMFTYAAPTAAGGTKSIGIDCALIRNDSYMISLAPMIDRYASLLAHAEISLKCGLVNYRSTSTLSTSDEDTADTIRAYNDKVYKGEHDVIIDQSVVGSLQQVGTEIKGNIGVIECIEARNELLRAFYNDIGVRYVRDKKERLIEAEASADDQIRLINISDMRNQRQIGQQAMSDIFHMKVSVDLSPEFQIVEG